MLIEKFRKRFNRILKAKDDQSAIVIKRNQHHLSRKNVSPNAVRVLYRLKKFGFAAHLVGGGVRDLLLSRQPKDFDIATDALPEQIRSTFRNSRIIGRRFRLVHVYFHGEIIEVSTFRANTQEPTKTEGMEQPILIQADNTYGTIEEDAWRRDFTVNALYYNIANFSIVDFTGGMEDLQRHLIRMIGDPAQRYHEDPVRLLRAIRLAAKLNFKIHRDTEEPLQRLSGLLQHVPASRLFDEVLKLFFDGYAVVTFNKLRQYEFFKVLFPQSVIALERGDNKFNEQLIKHATLATDQRHKDGLSLNPGFLFSIFLWPALQLELHERSKKTNKFHLAFHYAIDKVLREQTNTIMIPKRLTKMMRLVWLLQFHLIKRRAKRIERVFTHRYFRAAFDFLVLRAKAGEPYQDHVDWWEQFQEANLVGRENMINRLSEKRRK